MRCRESSVDKEQNPSCACICKFVVVPGAAIPPPATPNMLRLHLQLRAGLPPHPSINTNPIATTTTTPIARIVDPVLPPTDPNTSNPNLTRIHNCNFINAKTTFKFKCHHRCCIHNISPSSTSTAAANSNDFHQQDKSFWGAVTLIIGTAVGPGMLGLPAATIRSGPLPSTLAILLCWLYVISSVILVAELSFSAMEQDALQEVSFTALASKAFGGRFGAFVAVVYASLSFALLVACVSGIGSIVSQCFPRINLVLAHALFPLAAGSLILLFPFNAIDAANRVLCLLMLFSITSLVAIGLSVARTNLFASFGRASWRISSILPAIPVTVLTLGFHVITPFICKIAGNTVADTRNAILIGGAVPLIMVLSWNLIVLGLSGSGANAAAAGDPISLLLSVNPSALSAVQAFAFSALATSLIGYAVSFPKQLLDTVELIAKMNLKNKQVGVASSQGNGLGRVGFAVYSKMRHDDGNIGNAGRASFTTGSGSGRCIDASDSKPGSSINMIVMPLVLGVPVLIASFFPSTFSRALDFAGLYANCFLFGILPPAMAYIHQSRKKSSWCSSSNILPGGNATLAILFGIAVILGIWH